MESTFEPFRRTRLGKRAMMREFTNSTGRWSFVSPQLELGDTMFGEGFGSNAKGGEAWEEGA